MSNPGRGDLAERNRTSEKTSTVDINGKHARVWEIVEPIALEAGLELVDVEHRREGHGAVLRLFLDRPGGGVTLEQLTTVSRQVSDVLDVRDDALPGAYTLEVSSPGINRPLTRPGHFPPFVGKRVHVQTRMVPGERHSFRGTLSAVEPGGIVVTAEDGQPHTIPFEAIVRANYQHEFAAVGKRRGPARRAAQAPMPSTERR